MRGRTHHARAPNAPRPPPGARARAIPQGQNSAPPSLISGAVLHARSTPNEDVVIVTFADVSDSAQCTCLR